MNLVLVRPLGSPPRVRGKGKPGPVKLAASGLTPACAGKRTRPRRWVRPPRDHPRVCGEKTYANRGQMAHVGSPPRMRGKAVQIGDLLGQSGITPAYAGKRTYEADPERWKQDHPCVCGEKSRPFPTRSSRTGSPPRLRGKVLQNLISQGIVGITPAYAGKSIQSGEGIFSQWDHPRVCGEKTPDASSTTKSIGSPSRLRGKVFVDGEV